MRKILNLSLFFSFIILSSCQEGVSDCFKRNGDRIEIEYEVAPFRELHAFNGLKVFITQGDEYLVTVKAGEHIISDIKVKSEEGILSLTDEISCDWAREYEPKEVLVQCPDLRVIYQNGYGNIISNDTLFFDSLDIRPRYGQGNVTLALHSKYTAVVSHRNGTVTLTGKTNYLHVGLLFKTPIFDGKNFKAMHVDVMHNSNNSMHIYPIRTLRGRLQKKGNVYLYHIPGETNVEFTGQGKIIDKADS